MVQLRLHLLSVVLVIQTINSITINESNESNENKSINAAFTKLVAEQKKNSSLSPPLPTLYTIRMDSASVQRIASTSVQQQNENQSNYHHYPKTTINHAIENTDITTIENRAIPLNPIENKSNASLSNASASSEIKSIPFKQFKQPIKSNKMDFRKRKVKSVIIDQSVDWKCPIMNENSQYFECGCDMPHTLRCSGDLHGLEQIANGLRQSNYTVSLLDCTLKNVTFLSDARIFDNVSLHGLVISSGEIKRVHRLAFVGMKIPLQALGLPNNALQAVPWQSLSVLISLDRLDLSNNRIKYIGASDFLLLQNLSYLELSENHISGISMRAFLTLKKLRTLKLNGNRLEASGNNLLAIGQCTNLNELDLSSNLLRGPLTRDLLPSLKSLESLNLDTNLLTSIHTSAFENFPFLTTLSLRHNQIDVLQDHAFSGLTSLQLLDLSYNGIVAVSGASLKHLSRLLVLNLTHNFLRTLSSDLVAPLPSLKELQLDGNDISIVARDAFSTVNHLESLSLKDNPLSCDCSLKPFAEWMLTANISQKDQLSAACATPPHLEGATLQQIAPQSLNCNGNVNKIDNANVLQQLEIRSKQTNLTYMRMFSDQIILKKIHLSMDYGLILTWSVSLANREFSCDTIIVYKEINSNETLVDSSAIHCESYKMENENIVSVILYDITRFIIGENYRFCLMLVQNENDQHDHELVIGCSNITKLKQIENNFATEASSDRLRNRSSNNINLGDANGNVNENENESESESKNVSKLQSDHNKNNEQIISDISSFDSMQDDQFSSTTSNDNDLPDYPINDANQSNSIGEVDTQLKLNTKVVPTATTTVNKTMTLKKSTEKLYAPQLIDAFDDSLVSGIGITILISTIFALIWIATKLTNNRRTNPATVCYAAADQHSIDIENRTRYLKLQATTTL